MRAVVAILDARELQFAAGCLLPSLEGPLGQLRIVGLAQRRRRRCRAAPNTCISGARRLSQGEQANGQKAEPGHRLSASRSSASNLICASSCSMRLREIVDQLTLGIGKCAVFQVIAPVSTRDRTTRPGTPTTVE